MCITMSFRNDSHIHLNRERGSALIYILIAIALLGALTMTFMNPSSQQTSAQGGFKVITDIKSQVDTIRAAVQECALAYQKGDRTVDIGPSGTDPDARRNYPLNPNSAHFSGADVGPTEGRLVKDIRCPGNPDGAVNNHSVIFSGASGKFMPPKPDLFEDWQYYNGADGIFVWTRTNKTDGFLVSAFQKLDESYGECEADVIDATGGDVDLDSGGETRCEAGYRCFRVRLISKKANAVWNADADNDEAICTKS